MSNVGNTMLLAKLDISAELPTVMSSEDSERRDHMTPERRLHASTSEDVRDRFRRTVHILDSSPGYGRT